MRPSRRAATGPAINRKRVRGLAVVLALALGIGAWLAQARRDPAPVGLFTTLPILWNEAGDVGAMLKDDAPPHWVRGDLQQRGRIVPLDTLAAPGGQGPLAGLDRLVIAQPRPLAPAENVALDAWVRGGGRLLLLADPALTEESSFPLGDPRRPQAVVLLSPILARWGLDLQFDEAQQFGEAPREVMGMTVPVNLPGRWQTRGQANCRLWGDGLAVTCAIGQGRVVALADAAVLERDDPARSRERAFALLLDAAFVGR